MPITTPSINLTLNQRTLQVGGPDGWVDITDAECMLLKALAAGLEKRADTPTILECIGKHADYNAKHALEVQIVRLRKKLLQAGAAEPTIKAIRGKGYQLCVGLDVGKPEYEP